MFTTGSKFLIGASVVSFVATVAYGLGQDGVLGTVGLASATVCLIGLAVLNAILRDSNVFADDAAPVETTAAARYAPGAGPWPLALALGSVVVAVGLVTQQSVVLVGIVIVVVAGGEWMVQAWSEGASDNVEYNEAVRSRVANSLEYPVGAAVGIGIIIYSFSRVMLWLNTKTSTTVVFAVTAAVVLAVAFVIASRPKMSTGAVGGVIAVGAVAVVAAGAFTGVDGQREISEFESTSVWQEEGILHPDEYAEGAAEGEHPAELICESPEEFPEADEKASETVASKSGTYQVFLTETGMLEFDVPGPVEDGAAGMVVPRSNPTNVIFRNDSEEDRRLSLDLGTQLVEIEHDGETEEVEARHQLCTTLIEPGGAQLLTFKADEPSLAYDGQENPNGADGGDGFWFFVPGVDTARLQVIVP